MGRRRRKDKHLPKRVYLKGRVYYYVTPNNKWIRLADNEPEMYRVLADVVAGRKASTLGNIFDRYETEVLPAKAPKTQRDQRRQLQVLRRVYGKCQPDAITSADVAQYLDSRSAKTAANREVALLSHVYRKAIRWGLAERNPCQGVERNKESPDTRYIADAELAAVLARAPEHVRVAMELAYLTGQRQADILALRRSQLLDEGIAFEQKKTGKRLIVSWSPALREVIERAAKRPSRITSLYVIYNRQGQRYTESGFQTAWQRLMRSCLDEGVITERFTFRAIRAKARSDGPDKRLLGHSNPDAMGRIYMRKPEIVEPVK